ncbi:hypothetical protein [Allokutzneria albata]|uniref:Uncharacterized protein n=1 Tax=Allokutzneria albata TaxID=211114 RepID=A0A1G9WFP9_ALLAB|nr:hypothetical protein [Allokutzneria albata]SDM83093.1 hypothetical protein SAMN04489726_3574 [Allokutzneria albata]
MIVAWPLEHEEGMAGVGQGDGADGHKTVRELNAQLQALRKQRVSDDREGDQREVYLRGIALIRHDRDAGVSPGTQSCRTSVEQAMAVAEELTVAACRLWTRVQVAGLGEADPRTHAAKRAVEEAFRDAISAFSEALNEDETA